MFIKRFIIGNIVAKRKFELFYLRNRRGNSEEKQKEIERERVRGKKYEKKDRKRAIFFIINWNSFRISILYDSFDQIWWLIFLDWPINSLIIV